MRSNYICLRIHRLTITNKIMEILGKISGDNLVAAHEIARSIELTQEVHSYYAPNRIEKWFRYASNLQSIPKGRARIERYSEAHPRLTKLGDRLCPNWHSLLVCGGHLPETSTSIQWHRDHGHFVAEAVVTVPIRRFCTRSKFSRVWNLFFHRGTCHCSKGDP